MALMVVVITTGVMMTVIAWVIVIPWGVMVRRMRRVIET